MHGSQSWPLRLIDVQTLQLNRLNDQTPRYAILSHTWGEDEISLQEWESGGSAVTLKECYLKVVNACKQAERDGFDWLWADTCCIDKTACIDKTNISELEVTVQSMYDWYCNAEVCYALLSDVDDNRTLTGDDDAVDIEYRSPVYNVERAQQFRRSRWFRRGWTLQELLAPRRVVFYSKDWTVFDDSPDLLPTVSEITNIPEAVLRHEKRLAECSYAQRLSWAYGRETNLIEDQAYSLIGILDICMPPSYGEGSRAFKRLQHHVLDEEDGMSGLAWNSQDPAQSSCLLAPALECFRGCGDVERRTLGQTTVKIHRTIIGLSGCFPAILRSSAVGEHIYIPLNCYHSGEPDKVLALSLRVSHKYLRRGGIVECYVSPTEYSGVPEASATRLAIVNVSEQSLITDITIQSSPADVARSSGGIEHVIERSSGDRTPRQSQDRSHSKRLLPATILSEDEISPVKRLVDGSEALLVIAIKPSGTH
ncbi:hypothetical protein LTR27_008658 [Elasticomyces elasticus]|nr:hypothetical protein LTR27_008658 [Elasticomyces elasticus]